MSKFVLCFTVCVWFMINTAACTSISIQPTCPIELVVGDSGGVAANEIDAGAIPSYIWEVIPSNAGTFANATVATTTFTALQSGDALIQLTASDGIFQVRSQCTTKVTGPNALSVTLSANVNPIVVNQTITLTCLSTGNTPAATLVIEQTSGPSISLNQNAAGVVTLSPVLAGSPQFRCIGIGDDGQESAPAVLTLTVNETTGGGRR